METANIPNIEELEKYLSTSMDDEVLPISSIVKEKKKSFIDVFKTNFTILDEAIEGGFREGDLVVISGISGEGKTTLGQTLTYNFCKNSIPCLWFSYEISLERLNEKFEKMGISDFYYAFAPKKNTTGRIFWLKEKIKEGWIKYATKIVFIDHLDYIIPENIKESDNQTLILKQAIMQLKTLAIELKIIIFVMVHLKKLDSFKEPEMQDIGWSASIFQNADYVLIISRERTKQGRKLRMEDFTGDIFSTTSKIKIVKNRLNGRMIFFKVNFLDGKFIPLTSLTNDNTL